MALTSSRFVRITLFALSSLLIVSCSGASKVPTSITTMSSSGTTANYTPTSTSNPRVSVNNAAVRSTSSNQAGQSPIIPDPKLTPGDALDVTREDICVSGYSKKVRNVPQAVKEEAYREYGITSRQPREYEVDHLISLELGGSNSLKNLWPESFITEPWNAHVKDRLENNLHKMICSGEIDIKAAQHEIATDWIASYKKHVGLEPSTSSSHHDSRSTKENPNASPIAPSMASSSAQTAEIIGNKRSHIYHKPGCPDYDKVSEQNRVMFRSIAEAEQAGYRAAKNCP